MFKNYFKIAWRNLFRNKAFSAINISGLALGLTCSLLIMLWVQDERSVDRFHKNEKYLFQVYERQFYDGKVEANYHTQGLLADEIKRVIPEVQLAAGLESYAPQTFEAGNRVLKMEGSFAGADFFSMFSYPLLQGTAKTALGRPATIAISGKMARLFFGSPENAINKIIRCENKENLQISAVFENVPTNSSLQFDFLRTWQDLTTSNPWAKTWGSADPSTYLLLQPNADRMKVELKLKDFIYRYRSKEQGSKTELALQPVSEKYLHSTFKNGQLEGGRIEYVRLFSLVAVFILIVACINFMNLATARSTKRAKEVGVRKVIGAVRSILVAQFIGEAMLITFLSVFIAIISTILLLPAFNQLTGKQLSLPVTQPFFWLMILLLVLITGFIAGSYPAFFLAALNPIRVLKGSLKIGSGVSLLRMALVVFQFSLSVVLIVGMIVVYTQMNYIRSKNLGYDRQNLLYIPIEGDLVKNYELFKEQVSRMAGIVKVSKMAHSPTEIDHTVGDVRWLRKEPGVNVQFSDTKVGYDFVSTLGLKLASGRDFSKEFGTDSTGYLVNETAVKKIGYQSPVGQSLWWANREGKIIGVLKDFHFTSMHQPIEPLIIRLKNDQNWGTILVRIESGKTREALSALEKVCKNLNPMFPFSYQFSDQEYARLYKSEQVFSKLSNYFAFLAIFISCLGLFGLATFTASQRNKEIGVRKVLGASVPNIVTLLSAGFLKPVTIAFLIAFPTSWFIMNKWLQDFAYKIDIAWWMFAFAGFVTILIALLTVSFQSIKAAMTNPVTSLRSE